MGKIAKQINVIEMRKMQRISETKEQFVKNINKISKLLPNLTKRERAKIKQLEMKTESIYPKNMHCTNLEQMKET